MILQVILGEEVAASKLTIFDITQQICDAVQARAEHGIEASRFSFFFRVIFEFSSQLTKVLYSDKNHGVILLPEGLIESIPEIYALLQV